MSKPKVRMVQPQPETPNGNNLEARQDKLVSNINLAYRVGMFAVLLLSGIYTLSPIDAIPDIIPAAGQADDAAVLVTGGTSAVFMTFARFAMMLILHNRLLRRGCTIGAAIVIPIVIFGALLMFYGLYSLISRLV